MSGFYAPEGVAALRKLRDLHPEAFGAYQRFDAAVFEDGALTKKLKELIAVAAAHITQCPYCIDSHVKRATAQGATEEEIAESIFVAVALQGSGSLSHGSIAMHALNHQ